MAIREIAICLLILYTGTTLIVQEDIFAQDKSTSITCNNNQPCEKTACIDGDCDTTISNSSQISSTQESDTTDNDTKKSIINSIDERMSIRED
jgi:hypothetical protein